MGLDIGLADIAVANFLFLRGSLAFRQGEVFTVAVDMGGLGPMMDDIAKLTGVDLNPLIIEVFSMCL